MTGRWGGARLVAEREVRERVRSRSFRIITVILVIVSVAAVVVPAMFDDDGAQTTRIGVVGGPLELRDALTASAQGAGLTLAIDPASAQRAAAQKGVADGHLDAAVLVPAAGGPVEVVVRSTISDTLRAVIQQGLSLARLRAALDDAGVAPARVDQLVRAQPLDVTVTDPDESPADGDVGIGILVAVVLYVALLFAGTLVASGVAEEKASRVSEVLLASLRPLDLLVGKVMGIGLVSIVQLAVAAAPALVAAVAIGAVDLPDATASAVAWGLVWFVVGYALYAAAYGALGALVGRQQEVGQVTAPLAMLLLAGYLSAAFTASEPDGTLATVLSYVPPLSPLVMPVRIAGGAVGPLGILAALVVTLATAAVILVVGARIYRGGIVRTGSRISIREALRGARPRPAA